MSSQYTLFADAALYERTAKAQMDKPSVVPGTILGSSAVARGALNDIVSASGTMVVNVDSWRTIVGEDEQQNVEGTDVIIKKLSKSRQIGTLLARQNAWGASDFARACSQLNPADPLSAVQTVLDQYEAHSADKAIMSSLFGYTETALAANVLDITDAADAEDKLFSYEAFIDVTEKLGELIQTFIGGAMVVNPKIASTIARESTIATIPAADGFIRVPLYRNIPIIIKDFGTSRTVGGDTVYDTYIIGEGAIATGNAQKIVGEGLASLEYVREGLKGLSAIVNRTLSIYHPMGAAWNTAATIASGITPSNAELALKTNWTLAYESAKQVPILRITSAG